jgi:hypothetical protein
MLISSSSSHLSPIDPYSIPPGCGTGPPIHIPIQTYINMHKKIAPVK